MPAELLMKVWLVVRAEPRSITLIELGRVVFGRVLDLILRQADEDLLVIDVDPLDRPSRDDNLPAEDPRTGVDDDVGATGLGRRLIDLPDRAISRLNVTAHQRLPRSREVGECPQIGVRHDLRLLSRFA